MKNETKKELRDLYDKLEWQQSKLQWINEMIDLHKKHIAVLRRKLTFTKTRIRKIVKTIRKLEEK